MKRGGQVAASFRFPSVICPGRAGLAGPAPCRASPAPTVGSCSLRVSVDAGLAPHGLSSYEKRRPGGRLFPLSTCHLPGRAGLVGRAPCRASPALRVGSCSLRVSVDAGLAPHGFPHMEKGGQVAASFRCPSLLPRRRDQAASACSRRGPSASARPTMSTSRSSSASSMPKCGVKRSEFSPPWITLTPCMRSHSSVELAP